MGRKNIVLWGIGVMTIIAGIMLSHSDSEYEASFGTAVDFIFGVVRDVDHVGLTLTQVSKEREMEIGEEIHKRIDSRNSGRFSEAYSDDNRYLAQVGGILLEHARRKGIEYHFQVVDSPAINAFAVAGGYVYVTEGMMDFPESEAELAGVLAHEISHIDLKHGIERLQYELALRKLVGNSLASIARIGYSLITIGFSEQQEMEADLNGIQMAANSGYDPGAVVNAFGRLMLEEERGQATEKKRSSLMLGELGGAVWKGLEQYFGSHPSMKQRIQYDDLLYERNKAVWDGQRFYGGRSNYTNRISKKRELLERRIDRVSSGFYKAIRARSG
ncbi:MAG: M48 family metalloprotease [Gammaproteobacteria bacterium]|nr:M48 family metalloprotease [Gammaproteobacteria bacterium]